MRLRPVVGSLVGEASADFRFAAAVAGCGMLLRDSPHVGSWLWPDVISSAESALAGISERYRQEFLDLARAAEDILAPEAPDPAEKP